MVAARSRPHHLGQSWGSLARECPPRLAATFLATAGCPQWVGQGRFISAVTANRNMALPESPCSYRGSHDQTHV